MCHTIALPVLSLIHLPSAIVVALDFASVDWELLWQLAAEEGIQRGHRPGTGSGYGCTCVSK